MSRSTDSSLRYIPRHSEEPIEQKYTYLDTNGLDYGLHHGPHGKSRSRMQTSREPPADYLHFRREKSQHDKDGYHSDPSLDSTGKKKSFKKVIVRFADKTSMQGVPYINNAKKPLAKLIWAVLLLGALSWMVFHLFYLFNQYYQHPIQTKIKLSFSELHMPAVTVCNVNLVKKSKLNLASKQIQNFVQKVDPGKLDPGKSIKGNNNSVGNNGTASGTTEPPTQPPIGRKKRFVGDFEGIKLDNFTDYKNEETDHKGRERDTLSRIEDLFAELYLKENRQKRIEMGHRMKDMLVSCSFDGYSCYPSNFTLFQTADYGNCFTINASEFISTSSGPKSEIYQPVMMVILCQVYSGMVWIPEGLAVHSAGGLTLILYMENNEYIGGMSQGVGARVLIHTYGTFPFPDDQGFFVASAFETHIGMKKVKISRQGQPYGTCEEGSAFKAKYNVAYSRKVCQVICEQEKIIEKCDCYEDKAQELFYHTTKTSKHVCKTREEVRCMLKVIEEVKTNNASKCICDNPCNEDQYIKSISVRQWPTDIYSTVLMQSMCEQFPSLCTHIVGMKGDRSQLSQNFIKLKIYYEDLNYEEIIEEPEIELAQFVSDVGGAVGLWIGLSILSIFEVVQLVVELVQYAVHLCRHSDVNRKRDSEQQNKTNRQNKQPQHPQNGFVTDPKFGFGQYYRGSNQM